MRKEFIPYPIYFKNEDGVASVIESVTCGESFTAAIDKKHKLFMFGDNFYGQCGKDPRSFKSVNLPQMVKIKSNIYNVACGVYHVMAIGERYKIYTWGSNSNGQLGHGDRLNRHEPTEVVKLEGVCCSVIACGTNNSMAFDDVGTV
jgi:alpha-tubulin suppressor-like RCC1 family protein